MVVYFRHPVDSSGSLAKTIEMYQVPILSIVVKKKVELCLNFESTIYTYSCFTFHDCRSSSVLQIAGLTFLFYKLVATVFIK